MKVQIRTLKASKIKNNTIIAGVIYGGGLESTNIQVDAHEFTQMYRSKGTSKTFSINLEGKTHIVYIREIK